VNAPLEPPRLRDLDAVGFDLGGVMVRVDMARFFARLERLAASGTPADPARFFAARGDYHRFARGELDARGFHASIERRVGAPWPFEEFAQAWCDVFEEIPESVGAVRRLGGVKPLWVLSNTDPLHLDIIRRRWDWLACFQGLHLSYECGAEKPEPAFYASFLARAGVEPARFLFFDDLAANVEAARAAGLRAVQVVRPDDASRAVAELLDRG
jgi:glucose-1-phosphatase